MAAAALLTIASTSAHADDCEPLSGLSTCIVADNVWPQAGPGPWFTVGPTATTPAGGVGFGLVMSLLSRPVGLQVASADPEGTTIYAVDDVLDATFLTAVGVGDQVELTVAAPIVLYQNGASVADVVGSDDYLPRSAFGDLRVGVRAAMLPRQGPAGLGLAGRFEITAPTGDPSAFVGAGSAVYVPGVAFDHRIGRIHWGLDLSARIRETRELAGARIGSQIGTAAGLDVAILDDQWLSAGLEAQALFTLEDQYQLVWDQTRLRRVEELADDLHIPAEWLLSVRSAGLLDGQLETSLAGGSFIPTGSDSPVTTPRFRFLLGVRYTPSAQAGAVDDADLEQEQERDSVLPNR